MDAFELQQLKIFRAVGKSLSFTRAAEGLHISQPVVSRVIRELERSLGVDLFERTTRTVSLTYEGEGLLAISDQLLQYHEAARARFDQYCQGDRGRIVIAALPSIAASILPPVLADLLGTHPDISIEIIDVPATAALRELEVGHADVAITEPSSSTENLKIHLVRRDRFVAVLPRQHRFRRSTAVSWRDVASEPFVSIGHGSSVRRLADIAMARAGVAPTAVVESRNIATLGSIVAAGLGVSALPELALPLLQNASIIIRPLIEPASFRDIAVISRSGSRASPIALALLGPICDALDGAQGSVSADVGVET